MVWRLLIGLKEGSMGFYISKPGFDVFTATPDQLLFDSRLGNYASVVTSGVTNANAGAIFWPNLDYIPMAMVSVHDYSTGEVIGMQSMSNVQTGTGGRSYWVMDPHYTIGVGHIDFQTIPSGTYGTPPWGTHPDYAVRYMILRIPGT